MSGLEIFGLFVELAGDIVDALSKHTDSEAATFAAATAKMTLELTRLTANEALTTSVSSFEIMARGDANIQLAQFGYDGDHLPPEVRGARDLAVMAACRAFEKRGGK